jgi:hypothetical protein
MATSIRARDDAPQTDHLFPTAADVYGDAVEQPDVRDRTRPFEPGEVDVLTPPLEAEVADAEGRGLVRAPRSP